MQKGGLAVVDAKDGRLLEERRARGQRRAPEPAHVAPGVEDAAAAFQIAPEKTPRQAAPAHLLGFEQRPLGAEPGARLRRAVDGGELPRMHRRDDVSDGLVGAVDRVLLDRALDVRDGRLHEAHEISRARPAEEHGERGKILADCRRQMARVAPAGAVARDLALEDRDALALLAQREGRREPRQPGPDDGHVHVEITGECRRALADAVHPGADAFGHRNVSPVQWRYPLPATVSVEMVNVPITAQEAWIDRM